MIEPRALHIQGTVLLLQQIPTLNLIQGPPWIGSTTASMLGALWCWGLCLRLLNAKHAQPFESPQPTTLIFVLLVYYYFVDCLFGGHTWLYSWAGIKGSLQQGLRDHMQCQGSH